jgi:DNA-directed RNA polymerase specialized sigma subunit
MISLTAERAARTYRTKPARWSMYDFIGKNITAFDIENAIDQHIVGRNAERNRQILKSRFIDGLTYERLAEKYDLSVSHIKTIIYRLESAVYDNL